MGTARLRISALLAGLLLFRVAYGLSLPFWFEDERQVYLIGLVAFAHDAWPYFGADVVWTGGRVPGALLGWLVRGALEIWPAPEAPVVLVNLCSLAALAFFSWYMARRLPGLPRWLVWTAPFLLPWTLNFSTHVVNPSYVLAGGILFFIGFFEAMPGLRRGLLSMPVAWGLMAAGIGWTLQLHLSWVLLPPYVLAAFLATLFTHRAAAGESRVHTLGRMLAGGAIGFAISASLLAPTVMRHGARAGQVDQAVQFRPQSPLGVVTTAARVLSFASFETNRFLGQSGAERALLLLRKPWLVPFVAVLSIAGIVHPLWMSICAFRRSRAAPPDWMAVRVLTGATILLIYGSYFFSVRGPQAHAFYVVWPVAMLFAGTCWHARAAHAGGRLRRMEYMAAVVIAASVVVHTGLGIDRWSRQSLYVDRALVAAAIDGREPRWLGERRAGPLQDPPAITGQPDAAFAAAQATDDLAIVASSWTLALDRFSNFDVTVVHRGRAAAWLDVRFVIGYRDGEGRHLATSEVVVKQIVEPGDRRTWSQVPDRNAPPGAVSASIAVIGAEKVLPWTRPAA